MYMLTAEPLNIGNELLVVVIVIILVFALAWWTTRYLAKKTTRTFNGQYLKIVEKISLGKDKQVVLLEVGGRYILVGTAQQALSFSNYLEEIEMVEGCDPAKPEQSKTFSQLYKQMTTLISKQKKSEKSGDDQ